MLEKLKSYLRFFIKKPNYLEKGSKYGGFRLDIDKYYAKKENRKKLEKINNSNFPKIIKQKGKHTMPQPG